MLVFPQCGGGDLENRKHLPPACPSVMARKMSRVRSTALSSSFSSYGFRRINGGSPESHRAPVPFVSDLNCNAPKPMRTAEQCRSSFWAAHSIFCRRNETKSLRDEGPCFLGKVSAQHKGVLETPADTQWKWRATRITMDGENMSTETISTVRLLKQHGLKQKILIENGLSLEKLSFVRYGLFDCWFGRLVVHRYAWADSGSMDRSHYSLMRLPLPHTSDTVVFLQERGAALQTLP
jgi:hypothetical protein